MVTKKKSLPRKKPTSSATAGPAQLHRMLAQCRENLRKCRADAADIHGMVARALEKPPIGDHGYQLALSPKMATAAVTDAELRAEVLACKKAFYQCMCITKAARCELEAAYLKTWAAREGVCAVAECCDCC